MCNLSERLYIYTVDWQGNREFCATMLAESDVVRYCEEHNKVFRGEYDYYSYGRPCEDVSKWGTVRFGK